MFKRNIVRGLIAIFTFCISVTTAFAAGITIPASSSINVNTGTLNVAGDVTNAGTLLLTTGTIILTGSWANTGIFTKGAGTVTLRGTTQADITGTNNFYNLTIDTNADGAKTVRFGASQTQSVTNTLSITGYAAKVLTIRSTVDATQATIDIPASITTGVDYVDVKDSKIDDANYTITAGTNSTDSGNNINWIFGSGTPRTITGSLYQSDRTTKLTNQTVKLSVNGASPVQQTASSGDFTFNNILLSSTDKILVWIDDDATYEGNTVTVSDGNNLSGLNVYASQVTVRYETGSSITNANLSSAKGTLTDDDIKYSVSGANLTVQDNFKFYIPATYTFAPAGTIAVDDIEIDGALNAAGNDVTVSGDWDNSSGAYTSGANTTAFNGSSKQILTSGGTGDNNDFNNLTHSGSAELELTASNALDVDGTLTQSGAGDFDTQANSITGRGLDISNGSFNNDARAGTWDVNGNVSISSGTLKATSGSLLVSANWSRTGGIFTHNSGTVTFDTATTLIISGSTTFNNFTCATAGKQLTFTAGTAQTILGALTLTGTSASKIKLRSFLADSIYTITDSGTEIVSFVDVQDSTATNSVTAYNSTNSGNNTNWIFNNLSITYPSNTKTVGQAPTVIGIAGASESVTLKDKDGTAVATTSADANGNFRVAASTNLSIGANSLTPFVGSVAGSGVNLTVVASPTTDQVPTITSPVEGATVRGNKPTITGQGKANQSVTLTVKDENGNLLLSDVASTSVDSSGNYTISSSNYTTALPKGTNYISVTVDGVVSSIISVSLADPFGVVFDSVSNNPIKGAVVTIFKSDGTKCTPGVEIAATDSNPQTTGADGAYSFIAVDGNYYFTLSASGYAYPSTKTSFPSGRTIVTGSKGETFTVAGAVIEMDHPLDSNDLLLKIRKDANKKEVVVGDIITYSVTVQNETSSDVTSAYLEDKIPAGFKYLSGKAILDNAPIADPAGNRPVVFDIGTVSAGATKTLKYQLVVGSGVTFGNYQNTAFAKYSDGTVISNKTSYTVKVAPDTLFDLGTTIGKVFWDRNENGIQDPPQSIGGRVIVEEPIPDVQIATEDGTLITTDKDGKYHLPAIIPGRHLFRLDERTLPEGSYLTTDKVVIVDITQGLLVKVNFGVNSKDSNRKPVTGNQKLPVKITQQREKPQPRLNVSLFKDELKLKDGKLIEPAEFRVFTNYSLFIKKWKLEILDRDTKALIKAFEGRPLTINEPIFWDGKNRSNKLVSEDRNYVYVLTVTGKDGRQDVTKERGLLVREQKTEGREQSSEEIIKARQQWIERENKVNNLDKQNIRIDGETIKIQNLSYLRSGQANTQIQNVRILKSGNLEGEIPVVESKGLTATDLLEGQSIKEQNGQSEVEAILPKGEYDIEGQHIKVGDDYLFFVAMGDAKMGYTFNRGNIEPVQQDDKFKEGFWSEGKLAYYLKGRIKGKYFITSSLDTQRDNKELFKYIDPDKYYPIYGDASTINYAATNTQGPLYLLIEWNKSNILWGNYNTSFTDTEFAAFNRTLYGGKLHYESVSATQFGEPKTKLIVFRASAKQKAAHNEFIGTGGSLFYLKNRDVIEGSDKVKLEVRDKITGLVLSTKEMESGVEYEIDYSNARLIFWKPVSQITESDSIISSHLLDGNPVYVIVDYEYETKDKYDEGNYGVRLQQSLTGYLSVGGTYVKEEQLNKNYELKGTDIVAHLGKNIKLIGEYAESQSEEAGGFISTDGGLSFTELTTGDLDKGKAYGLKGEAALFERLGLTGYYKKIEKGFSSTSTVSQQGKELIGAGATLDITSKTRLKVSHDIQKLIDGGNPQTQLQVGALKTETSTAQITQEATDKLNLTAEYRHQKVTEKKEQFESETNTQDDAAAVKADYKATEKVTVSLEQQATLKGATNYQTSAGINAKVNESLSVRAKETVGMQGAATTVGATANLKDKFEVSSDFTSTNYKTGGTSGTASLTGKAKVDDKTEVHTTLAVTDASESAQNQSIIFGSKRKINEELVVTTDRSYAKAQDKLIQANTYGLTKEKDGRKLAGTFTEQRSQSNTEASNTNIFGLTGDINDKLAGLLSFERGIVQNLDGSQAIRNAGSLGLGFVDKDKETGEARLKASSKLELRLDNGQENKRQYLAYNAVEGEINPNTTLFAKANISQMENTTTNSTEAQYKELVSGVAYRPVNFDRLNLLGRYTYLEDNAPSGQSDFSDIEKEKSHTLAGEAVYDLTDKWQLVEKLAYKIGEEKVSGFDFTKTQTWLMAQRINYKLDKDWQVGAEYRRLSQKQAKDSKQGVLVEVARKVGEFIQIGLGYNFTDFNDDLTHLDYTAQGPFVRFTAKFYDRTPEEIERARQRWLLEKIDIWAWELVNNELAKPDSQIMQELIVYFYLADKYYKIGELSKAQELYELILRIGRMMYDEARDYVARRIELENRLKEYDQLAMSYYKSGNLQEAKRLWEMILIEAR